MMTSPVLHKSVQLTLALQKLHDTQYLCFQSVFYGHLCNTCTTRVSNCCTWSVIGQYSQLFRLWRKITITPASSVCDKFGQLPLALQILHDTLTIISTIVCSIFSSLKWLRDTLLKMFHDLHASLYDLPWVRKTQKPTAPLQVNLLHL